jgi:2-dehydropantoate 2-reductase
MPKIAVLGLGGVGGCIAAYLVRAGHDLTLIDQWPAHIEAIKKKGLTLTDVDESFTVPATALHLSEVSLLHEPFDVVFMSVKSYDTVWSTHLIGPHLKPGGMLLPAMNALNDELVAQIVGYQRTVGCVPTISSGAYEPGHVQRTDPKTLHAFTVGELSGLITPRVRQVVEWLQVIGPSDATSNIWGSRWSKMVWNSMNNAMAGLMGPQMESASAEQKELAALVNVVIAAEAARVAVQKGVAMEPTQDLRMEDFAQASTRETVLEMNERLAGARARRALTGAQVAHLGVPNRPSLLQDVVKGRRTEVDYLNGAIAQMGRELDIPTPMNDAIVRVVHELEAGKRTPGPHNLEALKPFLGF